MANDDSIKAAVLKLLKRGHATQSELARLSGRSRQIISVWAQEYPDARPDYLAKLWQRALIRGRSES